MGSEPFSFHSIQGAPSSQASPTPLENLMKSQQDQAASFRNNLPTMKSTMAQNLAQSTNQKTDQNLNSINSNMNSRGLLYGGMSQGLRSQERGNEQMQLAQGKENINTNLDQAANTMDQNALQTGFNVQAGAQAMQDQIYKQALVNMQNQNSMYGSILGAGAMLGAAALV